MPISAQEFKDAASRRRKTVDVEVEGLGAVRLRALSAWEKGQFQAAVTKRTGGTADVSAELGTDLMCDLIARMWIGEDGNLLMPEPEGVTFARTLEDETLVALTTAALQLLGISKDAVDDAVKNSEASRGDSSPTGSLTSTTG